MKRAVWRLIVDAPQSAAQNMATDEAISMAFEAGKVSPTLRFYAWDRPSFSIGAFQALDAAWIDALTYCALPLVRRMTGGRGLLHHHELTYSLVASTRDTLFCSGLKQAFQQVSEGLILGLQKLQLEAQVQAPAHSGRQGAKKPLCFDAVSGYEITARDKKLIGSAQRRWKNHFLQHGSLLLKPSDVVLKQDEQDARFLMSKNQITLHELIDPLPTTGALLEALCQGFEEALNVSFEKDELSPFEEQMAAGLLQEKYGCLEWNRNRGVVRKNAEIKP